MVNIPKNFGGLLHGFLTSAVSEPSIGDITTDLEALVRELKANLDYLSCYHLDLGSIVITVDEHFEIGKNGAQHPSRIRLKNALSTLTIIRNADRKFARLNFSQMRSLALDALIALANYDREHNGQRESIILSQRY